MRNFSIVTWKHTGKDRWWDPMAWSLPAELHLNAIAVPDVHRVPCVSDAVLFPDPKKYLAPIHFEPPTVTVAAVTIAGKVSILRGKSHISHI